MSKPKSRAKAKKSKSEDENKESIAWKVLTEEQTKEVMTAETVDDVQHHVISYLDLSQHECDLKQGILLDYYVSAIWWLKEQSFSNEQTSAFFTLAHTLLHNVKEKQMNIVDNLNEMKRTFMGIGVEHCEGSGGLECFDTSQAMQLADYLHTSLFQHYKLYEYMFSATQAEEIIGTDLELEVAPLADMPWPPPLDEGLQESLYQQHMVSAPPSPQPQEAEQEAGEGETSDTAGLPEGTEDLSQKEADLLAQLTPDQVKVIMQEVFDEMLTGLQTDVAQKLRDKEHGFINRINKIHKVADK